MSPPLDCPPAESWRALLAGAAPPGEQERYEHHLESCPACRAQLERLESCGDDFLRLARQAGDPTTTTPDPALAQVMDRLLEANAPNQPPPAKATELGSLAPATRPGLLGTLGGYEVEEVIGQGGMGVVLKAFEPALHRPVAIKVLAAGLAGNATARLRFQREGKAAAAVCHDNVVAVHGVGEVNGLPYLVMQYVAGESLQDRLDRAGPLPVEEAVRIGQQTAAGLAAAHAQGLIHRDIKPANLLLENGVARVKITDFGIARMTDDAGLTRDGVVAGTPEYMAPEQARGEPVDHRADLYALGAVLYACCTGRPPFRGATALAVLRQVNDEEPAPLRSLNPAVPGWLEAFVTRLMAKDPAARFQSAAEVAALLEGYLAHLRQPAANAPPLLPPRPGPSRPRPHGAGAGVGAVRATVRRFWLPTLVLLAALGVGFLSVISFRTGQGQGPPGPPNEEIDPAIRALALSPDGKRLITAGSDHDVPGQFQIWDVAARKPLVTRRAEPGVPAVAYSPDGQVFATGHWGGEIKLRDPVTGDVRATLTGHQIGANGLAFSPDGALLASAGLDSTVRVWDVKALRERQVLLGHEEMVFDVAFFHHSQAIVSGSHDRTARIWDLDTGKERFVLRGHATPVDKVAVSPDDKVVVTGTWTGALLFWDPKTGARTGSLKQKSGVNALAFSPDGKFLATGSWDGTVYLWDMASRKQVWSAREHGKAVRGLAFSPDGQLLVSGSEDGTARLWEVTAGRDGATGRDGAVLSAVGVPATPDAPADTPARSVPKGWLAAAVVIGLLTALALLGVLLLARRRPQAGKEPAANAPAVPEAPPPLISVACPNCGHGLKVKAALAGKKGKCPRCAHVVLVPAPVQAARPVGPPG